MVNAVWLVPRPVKARPAVAAVLVVGATASLVVAGMAHGHNTHHEGEKGVRVVTHLPGNAPRKQIQHTLSMLKRYPGGQALGLTIGRSDTGVAMTPHMVLGWAVNQIPERRLVCPTKPRTRVLDKDLNNAVSLLLQQMGSKLQEATGLPERKKLDLSGKGPPAGQRARQVMELKAFTMALHVAGLLAPHGGKGFIMAEGTETVIREVYQDSTASIRKAMEDLDGAHEAIVEQWAVIIDERRQQIETMKANADHSAPEAKHVWASVWEACYGPWAGMHGYRSDYAIQTLDDHVRTTRDNNGFWLRLARDMLNHDPTTSSLFSVEDEADYEGRSMRLEPALSSVVMANFMLAGLIGGSHKND